jgi:hypothetical protein
MRSCFEPCIPATSNTVSGLNILKILFQASDHPAGSVWQAGPGLGVCTAAGCVARRPPVAGGGGARKTTSLRI